MAVNIGNTQIQNIYLGSTAIKNIYLGNTLIYNSAQSIIDAFKIRVVNDGGTFEAESNLLSILNSVDSSIGLSKVNMLLTPNAFKTSKAYNVIGNTDFTVLRNTVATRVNASGVIVTEVSNIMRIDYKSGTPIILDEPQATNLLNFSREAGNAYYGKANCSIIENQINSPANILDAEILRENTANAGRSFFRLNFSISGAYTVSIFVKYLDKQWISLNCFNGSDNKAWFDLINGQVGTIQAGATAAIESFANGWYKLSVTAQGSSNCGIGVDFANSNGGTNNYLGNGTSGYYIWQTQLQTGSSSSSSIFTTNAAVTRNEDVLTVTPPAGTVRVTTTFLDNTTQVLNTIPATFTLPQGQIRQVVFQSSL